MSCKYFLLLILLTCKVGLSERCMNVNSRRDFDSCQTWILYLFFILNPSTAYDQEYKGMVIFAENILNLCKDEMARKGSVNYIVELTPDGGIRARDVLNSTMEYYEFYERSRLQRSSNLSAQLELAREMVKQHNVTTDGEAVYLLTNVPCERIAANPQLYGGLADFINLMPTFTDVPYQLLWITNEGMVRAKCDFKMPEVQYGSNGSFNTTYMDDAWNFSKETLYSLGMCFMNPNVSMAPDITIGFFEILSTTVLPDDYHYKGIYIGLIVFIWLIAALSVFFTVRRLFYREWRPWAPITDRVCCCKHRGKKEKEIMVDYTISTKKNHIEELSHSMDETPFVYDSWEIQRDSLEISEKKLGAGAYAVVYEATLKGYPPAVKAIEACPLLKMFSNEKNQVAVKMPPLYANFADREEFLREITFMKQLGFHPHLLTLLGCYSRSAFPLIIMELCDKGDLLSELIQMNLGKGELLEVHDLAHIAWQISDALIYLDDLNIIHRDIAARNVLLTGNKFAKLGDFGLCRLSQDQHYVARGGRLPVKWTAPEALERNEFSNKSDIWSFGVFLFEMFSLGQQPYHSMQPEEILSFLREGRRLERPAEASERIWKVMCWCWKFEAKSRPKAHEVHKVLYREIESSYSNYG